MSDYIDGNVNNLIIQYSDKPKAVSTIAAITEEFELIYNNANLFADAFDVDLAVGKQLDIVGKIVGQSRTIPFSVPKKYFGFDDNTASYPMGDKFNIVVSYPLKDKFEIPYSSGELNDYNYRIFIKAKIIKNYVSSKNISDTNLAIQNAIDFLFDGKAYMTDSYRMSMTLYIDSTYDITLLQYLQQANLLPRPQAVRYNTLVSYTEGNTFGFGSNNKGFADKFDTNISGGYFATKII